MELALEVKPKGGKELQKEGTENTKAERTERTWNTVEIKRRPESLEHGK